MRISVTCPLASNVVAVPVLVAKLYWHVTEVAKALGVFLAQGLGNGETIDENALTPFGVIDQAMQKLQPRLQLARRQVGVQGQVEGGVGIAVGIGFGLHIEQHAKVAFADKGDTAGDQRQ
jgi:hypothetical protein